MKGEIFGFVKQSKTQCTIIISWEWWSCPTTHATPSVAALHLCTNDYELTWWAPSLFYVIKGWMATPLAHSGTGAEGKSTTTTTRVVRICIGSNHDDHHHGSQHFINHQHQNILLTPHCCSPPHPHAHTSDWLTCLCNLGFCLIWLMAHICNCNCKTQQSSSWQQSLFLFSNTHCWGFCLSYYLTLALGSG